MRAFIIYIELPYLKLNMILFVCKKQKFSFIILGLHLSIEKKTLLCFKNHAWHGSWFWSDGSLFISSVTVIIINNKIYLYDF